MDSSRNSHSATGGELNVDEPLREGLDDRTNNVAPAHTCKSLLPNSPSGSLAGSVNSKDTLEAATVTMPPSSSGPVRVRQRKYIHVLVRSSMGSEYNMRMRESDTVERIKLRISARSDVPCGKQQLIFNGDELGDNLATAKSLGIRDGSTLYIVPRLQAGPLKMHADGDQGNEDILIDTVTSQLSDSYMSELFMSGHPVSLIAKVSGRFVVVRLRPRTLAPAGTSTPTAMPEKDLPVEVAAAENLKRNEENEQTRSQMAKVRERMAERKRLAACSSPAKRHGMMSTVDAAGGVFGSARLSRHAQGCQLKDVNGKGSSFRSPRDGSGEFNAGN